MEDFRKNFQTFRATFILIILIVLLIVVGISYKPIQDEREDSFSQTESSDSQVQGVQSELVLQTNYNESIKAKIKSDKISVVTSNPSPTYSLQSSITSVTTKPSAPKVVTLVPTQVSDLDSRNKDKQLIIDDVKEIIEQYYFHYEKYPELYSNKSKVVLNEASSKMYFYNEEKNITNALGIEAINYLFQRTEACNDNSSQEQLIEFIYDTQTGEIVFCKEAA